MKCLAKVTFLLLWLLVQGLGIAYCASSWSGSEPTGSLPLYNAGSNIRLDNDLASETFTMDIPALFNESRQTSLSYDAAHICIFLVNMASGALPVGKGDFLVAKTVGSGPASGFLEVSDAYASSKAVQNFASPTATDFIFDSQSGRFIRNFEELRGYKSGDI